VSLLSEIYEHTNWNPDQKERRQFGYSAGSALLFVGVIITLNTMRIGNAQKFLWMIGLLLIFLGAAGPEVLLWPYRVLMAVTTPIMHFVQRLLLMIFYYGMITPVGLVFRVMGRDPLKRTFDEGADSYWLPYKPHRDPRRYYRQY